MALLAMLPVAAQSYEKLWKEVGRQQEADLPQSVIRTTEQIYRLAEREGNFPQMVKAFLTRSSERAGMSRDSAYVDARVLERWAVREPNPAHRAVLWMALGNMYGELGSTAKADPYVPADTLSDDLSEWPSAMFHRAGREAYGEALKDMPLLARTKVDAYALLVEKGEDSALFGHDLLSLMVRNVSERYPKVDDFDFVCGLFERAAACYRSSGNRAASALMQLQRLTYLYENDSEQGNPLYRNEAAFNDTLRRWTDEVSGTPMAPYLFHGWLDVARSDSLRYVLGKEALEKYPRYKFADYFRRTLDGATSPFLRASLEKAPLPGRPLQLSLRYRSVDGIRVKIKEASSGRLVEDTSCRLRLTVPYAYVDTLLALSPLPGPGRYTVEIGDGKAKCRLEVNHTGLMPLMRDLPDRRRQFIVVDRLSGHPVEGARVEWFEEDYVHGKIVYRPQGKAVTDAEGKAYCENPLNRLALLVSKEGYGQTDTLDFYSYFHPSEEVDKEETLVELYTDRAVYRPGQVIRISGLVYHRREKLFRVVENRTLPLEVRDVNGQVLARLEVKSNDMGSFSTQVALPESCMSGTVTISGGRGSVYCRVEEYKRPVFEVELSPVREAYTFGDSIRMEGRALNYAGTPLAGAEVRYTVTARSWGVYRRGRQDVAIASGKGTTDDEGRFAVPFRLLPLVTSGEIPPADYQVEVEVTGAAGETRRADATVRVAEHSLLLSAYGLSNVVKEELDSVRVSVCNTNGVAVDTRCELQVCPLTWDAAGKEHAGEPVCVATYDSNRFFYPSMLRSLPSGRYCVRMKATDAKGRVNEEKTTMTLFGLHDKHIPVNEVLWSYNDSDTPKEGKPVTLLLGTSAKDAYLFYDVFVPGKHLESRHILLSDTLLTLRYDDKPEYADGAVVQWIMVKDGEKHEGQMQLAPRKQEHGLKLEWATFRDRLRPGEQEEWRLKVTLPDGSPADAELLATLYDASLDCYAPLQWGLYLHAPYRLPYLRCQAARDNLPAVHLEWPDSRRYKYLLWHFDRWRDEIKLRDLAMLDQVMVRGYGMQNRKTVVGAVADAVLEESVVLHSNPIMKGASDVAGEEEMPQRTDFSETAFFYPHIRTDKDGVATLAFTLPESLTTWCFKGLAHTKDMHYGLLNDEVVASKDFMLQAQLPRFVRVGDEATLSATLDNRAGRTVRGTVRMELFDPQTGKVSLSRKQSFEVAAGKSAVVSFQATLNETALLACRMVADGDAFSDGEQRYLPVLSDKEWMTESRTVTVTRAGHSELDLKDLFNHGSRTATNRRLTVEYTNHPAWLAVMALPSLAQPSLEDALSLASAYYALRLGGWVAEAYPRIREVCEAWQAQGGNGETLWSQLQKNRELKNILLEETPWLNEAESEAEQRRMLQTLFDLNSLQARTSGYLTKLGALQRADGAWSWYPGMGASRHVTTGVVEMLLRLNRLTDGRYAQELERHIRPAMNYLAVDMQEECKRMKESEAKGVKVECPSELTLHYLYLRTLYKDTSSPKEQKAADYFLDKLEGLTGNLSVFGKAVAACTLHQAGRREAGRMFLQSLLEYSVQTPELGRYYDADIARYSWADYRIPTQAMVVETCRALGVDDRTVGEFQQWLLKQKQVQDWTTPVNTVNAVYALLDGRETWLDATEPARLQLDNRELGPEGANTALGYVKQTITLGEADKAPRSLTVEQSADHLSWGAVYAQYLEELEKVEKHATGLSVERHLLVRRMADGKGEWRKVKPGEVLSVGDRVLSRLVVHADRDLDFVQMEDKQAACMEPGVVLSGYQWNAGTGCYRVVKDASVRYFVDRLRKGVHTFDMEYSLTARGTYRLGTATLQSAYAPELNAHSAAAVLIVR